MGRKKRKFFEEKGKKIFLLVSIIILSCSINHAGDIVISNNVYVGKDVAGNGSGANGTRPFAQTPNSNKVRILNAASVRGEVCGASNDGRDIDDVRDNEVIIETTGKIYGKVNGGWSLGGGKATNNKVVISSGDIRWSVGGGESRKGEARGNVVEIKGGSIGHDVYGGLSLEDGKAINNKVVISSGDIGWSVRGGESRKGEARGNVVEIKGGNIGHGVYGGLSLEDGKATNNKVVISSGDIKWSVKGGESRKGEAIGNVVEIKEGNIESGVNGGWSQNGEVKENVVEIKGGAIGQNVIGGWTLGNAISNKVEISNGSIRGYVFGGESINGEAIGNEVKIKGGNIGKEVYGGRSLNREAIGNKVIISNGNIKGKVHGGWSDTGEATGNVVWITGGNIWESVFGGYSSETGSATNNKVVITRDIKIVNITSNVIGGWTVKGEARENVVEINGGSIGQDVRGGYSLGNGNATSNKVTISDVNITNKVYGGWSIKGEARENVVEITRGIMQSVYGGRSSGTATNNKVTISAGNISWSLYGGRSDNGEAIGNEVEIKGGIFGQNVNGGRSRGTAINNIVAISNGGITGNVYGGRSDNGEAIGNVVEITGGTLGHDVYGGCSLSRKARGNKVLIRNGNIRGKVYGGWSINGEATENEIEIEGSPTFSSTNTIIYGGYSRSGKESKRGNILKIRAKGIEVLGIENFGAYKFYNPTESTPMVIVGNEVDLDGAEVSIEELDSIEDVEIGERYVLIKSSSGIKGIHTVKIMSTQTILARYDCANELAVGLGEDNELRVMVRNIEVNTKSKELTEARVGSMIFVGDGISREIGKEIQGEKGSRKVKPFVVVREGKSKYGNEIKEVGGVRVGGGIVKEIEKLGRNMVLGGYVEYGDGKYRSKEEIGGEVNSRGKSNYVGIGVKGEVEIKERIHGQIGMRIGRYGGDFESDDMGVGSKEGEEMKYDIEGMYAGVEVGGRYKVVEKEKIGIEVKGEVGMMSMGGKEVKLTSGNKVDFKGVKIGKVRMEVRGEYEVKEKVKPYVGLGGEYDKMWDVEAKSGNLEIPSSHIEGISGIGEMGVEVEIGKIGIKCGCECYVGEREEIDGMLKMRYAI